MGASDEATPEDAALGAVHACWRRGDLTYLLHEGREPDDPLVEKYVPARLRGKGPRGQIQALEAMQRVEAEGGDTFVLKTGRQWGKSLLFVVIASMLCVRAALEGSEAVRVVYAAPSSKQVDEFITPHFLLLQRHAPPELRPEHNQAKGAWEFPDGSRVVVAGCEDAKKADRLRGPRAHMGIVDEAGFIPIVDYVIESVLGWQLATTGGMLLVSSTPPTSMDHPFIALWEAAQLAGCAYEACTPEAPHMTGPLIEKVIRRTKGTGTTAWLRESLALLIADPETAVLPEFSASATVIAKHERPTHYYPCIIGDGGGIDLAVYLFGYYDFEADLDVIEDELVFRRTRSDVQDEAIRAKEAELWPGLEVRRRRVDAAVQVRLDMNREEWGEEGAELAEGMEPPHWQCVTKPRARHLGSMEQGSNRLRVRIARDAVRVHPRCKTTIAHCTSARWDGTRTEFVRVRDAQREPIHHYDGAAAAVYFSRDLDRGNPYPILPDGVGLPTHMIREHRLRTTDDQNVLAIFGRGRRR